MAESTGFTIRVVEVLLSIPAGRVMTATQVARLTDRPDAAEAVSSTVHDLMNEGVPWWRVVRDEGHPPVGADGESLPARALEQYLTEGTPLKPSSSEHGYVVDLEQAAASIEG